MSPLLFLACLGAQLTVVDPSAPPSDALAVITTGSELPEDLETDVGEPLAFALGRDTQKGYHFLPLDQVRTDIGYGGASAPGACVYDDACLRAAKARLGVRHFILVRLAPAPEGLSVTVKRIADAPSGDVSRSRTLGLDVADAINAASALVGEVVAIRRATVVVTVNEPGATIEVAGVQLAPGVDRVEVEPGLVKVRVAKEGFSPYEGEHTCRAGETCAVAASLAEYRDAIELPVPEADPLGQSLVISGWSVFGGGVALAVAGMVLDLKAADLQSSLERDCEVTPCATTRASAESDVSRGEDLARNARILYGVGGGVAAVGLVTAVLGHTVHLWNADVQVDVGAQLGRTPGINATIRF